MKYNMKNTIARIFNLEPNEIESIQVEEYGDESIAFIRITDSIQHCPRCAVSTRKLHDNRTRELNHAVINGTPFTLVYNYRRFKCPACGKVFPEANPFAAPHSRLSRFSIIRGMTMLKNPRITFSQVAMELGVSVNTVIRMFDKYAGITQIDMPECLCIDEVYMVKYKQKVYACVMVDMLTNQIYDLRPSRKKFELSSYFSSISYEDRSKVKYICIDMWKTYRDLSYTYFPNAKVCVDSFHVIQLINRMFTGIRVKVMKQFDEKSEQYRLLKKYHWILDKDMSKLNLDRIINLHYYHKELGTQYINIRNLLSCMLQIDPELEIAYEIKDRYTYINKHYEADKIEAILDDFIDELPMYGMQELESLSRTLLEWRNEIINSYDRYQGRRISNGPVESLNARLKTVKNNACGYKNFDRFRTRALYSLNRNSSIKNKR